MTIDPAKLKRLIACAERELRMREKVYPRWVEKQRMTQHKADAETQDMREILAVLVSMQPPAPPSAQGGLAL